MIFIRDLPIDYSSHFHLSADRGERSSSFRGDMLSHIKFTSHFRLFTSELVLNISKKKTHFSRCWVSTDLKHWPKFHSHWRSNQRHSIVRIQSRNVLRRMTTRPKLSIDICLFLFQTKHSYLFCSLKYSDRII